MKRQADSLSYLEQVRQHLSRLPSIDPTAKTILLCGCPNVGKSSFLNKVTRATDVEVAQAAYLFQPSKSLHVGRAEYKYQTWQVIDTPGILLDRPLEERNTLELQTIAALAHLRCTIVFVVDFSEQCGYTIGQQLELYASIKHLFVNKLAFVINNKIDIIRRDQLPLETQLYVGEFFISNPELHFREMSTATGANVLQILSEICDLMLAWPALTGSTTITGSSLGGGVTSQEVVVLVPPPSSSTPPDQSLHVAKLVESHHKPLVTTYAQPGPLPAHLKSAPIVMSSVGGGGEKDGAEFGNPELELDEYILDFKKRSAAGGGGGSKSNEQLNGVSMAELRHQTSSAGQQFDSSKASAPLTVNKKQQQHHHQHKPAQAHKADQNEITYGFEIAWLNFTYSVGPNLFEDPRWGKVNKPFHKERRMILKGLSGGLKSGQMVALMGPSGAGKTCLLESISGVRTSGIGGRMCLRGRKRAQLVIVPQYDDFMPQFSVEETIVYGSRMKNAPGTNHKQVAQTVIEQLGLQVCRHNNIQRCSGGQRKRVAIAQELVSKPNILILDEPTSGLDSSCCYHTMKVLRDVLDQSVRTDEPMAIVCTIHQPSAKVFKLFDLVYLLGKTGYVAYSGPPNELVATINDVTGLECPKYSNPSDFMIELVAYDYGEEPVNKLIDFERTKADQFVRDFDRRSGRQDRTSTSTKTGNATTTTTSTSQASRKPSVSSSTTSASSSSSSSSSSASASASVSATMSSNLELGKTIARVSKGGATGHLPLGQSSSSTIATSSPRPRLKPSKSDTHLVSSAAASCKDKVKRRLATSDLLASAAHVTYRNNVTLPLRQATSNNNRHHPFLWHTLTHVHRSFLQAIRDPILNNMRILIHLGFASLLVMLYGKKSGEARGCPPVLGLPAEITDPHNESMIDLADNVGYLFMCIMMITYVSLMSTVLTFPIDIKTVGKEYKNGWYGTITYFLGKTIADLPFIIVYPVTYCLITWFLTNQAQDHYWRYFSFTGLIIMNAMNSQSFGLILGALFVNSVTAATFLGPVITIPWYLFTGFTKRTHRLVEPFKSTSKFLFTRYIFEGILDTVYGHQRCNCSKFLEEYYELRYEEASRLGQLISVETLSSLDYYDGLETVADVVNETLFPPRGQAGTASNWFERTVDAASTVFADSDDLNLASLMDTNVKASSLFSFGLDFEPSCPSDYETYVVQDFRLGERNVQKAFVIVFCMLCVIRVMTFVLVAWKIRTRQL